MRKLIKLFGKIQFWGWNIFGVFILSNLMGLLVLPIVTLEFFRGDVPLSILICTIILVALPFIGLWAGFKKPHIVVPFFFGVQLPIFFLTIFRMFLMRQMTWGGALLVFTALLAGVVFMVHLWKIPSPENQEESLRTISASSPSRPWLTPILMTPVLITGSLTAILAALYTIPLTAEIIRGFFKFRWLENTWDILAIIPFITLFALTISAIIFFPFYVGYYYPKMWWTSGKLSGRKILTKTYLGITAALVLGWFVLHAFSSATQAGNIFALNKAQSDELTQAMKHPKKVRKALVEGYLYEYRYLGTEDQQNNLTQYYRRVFGSKAMGKRAQSIQSFILGPLIYKGKPDVKTQAAKLYDELFDMPIQRGERQAITKALSATYNRDEVTAGLMNVGIRNVEIVDQNIRSDDRGDYAIIEIEESYKNLTFGPQEIFYYFSLPEDAVMTGIWIGQTRDRAEMDTYIVAPRGAAQKVYEQQVRQRIDPALLEQVGPGQYRLRVFPIPVSRLRNSMVWEARERRNGENMNVHMRYVVPRSPEGFALPVLSEKRNVDWSRKTQRRLNGKPVKAKDWMPIRFIKAAGTGPVNLTSKLSGQTVSVKSLEGSIEQPPIGRFAVLVDTSKSMEAYKTDLGLAFKTIETWRQNGSDIRISLTDKRPYEGPDMAVPFFGNKTPSDILQRFQAQEQIPYDAVILLTDKGRYARSPEDENLAISAQNPIWVWHLGPAPSAIDDNLLDAIYSSGGGMARSAADLAAGLTYGGNSQRVQNGRLWTLGDQGEGEAMKDSALTSLAARQVILQGSFGTKPDNAALDEFHRLAKTYDVVSPYSSMIVLVNDRQREALKKASEAEDRFDREGRSGEENLTSPNSPLVSAVPEPHEWLLIIVSLILLLWLWRRERNTASSFA